MLGGGGGGAGKIFKFKCREWHLQHLYQNAALKHCFNGAFWYKSHAKHRKPTFQRKYLHDYLHL
jgi:hypothetical protein